MKLAGQILGSLIQSRQAAGLLSQSAWARLIVEGSIDRTWSRSRF